MKYVGVDLHKHVIVLCVVVLVRGRPKVAARRRFECRDTRGIRAYFEGLRRFQVVVEATAAYEWFFQLIEDRADRLVLAHPKKLRVIAESTRKSDKIDAEVLGVFLARDMVPEAWRPCFNSGNSSNGSVSRRTSSWPSSPPPRLWPNARPGRSSTAFPRSGR